MSFPRLVVVVSVAAVLTSDTHAQQSSIESDIKTARELLRKTHGSARYFEENAARRLADWKAAVEKGSPEAMWLLGRCYTDGHGGVEQDEEKGAALIKKSAEKGFALGQNGLGYVYQHGEGVEKDFTQALIWYRKAAEQGEPVACMNLAVFYEKGQGVETSVTESLRWYEKAAAVRYQPAIRRLVGVYESGMGEVKANPAEVVKWSLKLGEAGDPKGTAKAVLMYEQGKGIPKDAAEAKRCREKLREMVGNEAEDYVLLVDVLDGANGKKAPNVKGVIEGKPFKLSDHAGKVVVFRFTAAWCGTCREMNPQLQALTKKYDANAFAVVDVDIDKNSDLVELWQVAFVPAVYVLDHTGVIRDAGSRGEALDKAVADLIAEAAKKDK